MTNQGDSVLGRTKASITRQVHGGTSAPKPPKLAAPKLAAPRVTMTPVPHDGDVDVRPKLQPYKGRYKFLGSMKKGGRITRTGLWLMHEGEHVHSPYAKRGR